jgi:AP-3 complex subunit delta-1
LIMECIDDADLSIRLRALDIVVGMVSAHEIEILLSWVRTQFCIM